MACPHDRINIIFRINECPFLMRNIKRFGRTWPICETDCGRNRNAFVFMFFMNLNKFVGVFFSNVLMLIQRWGMIIAFQSFTGSQSAKIRAICGKTPL